MDKIESHIMAIYKDIQEQLPKLHHLSFGVSTYEHSGETSRHGYIHVGTGCESFSSISKLRNIIRIEKCKAKNEILYRNFKGVL